MAMSLLKYHVCRKHGKTAVACLAVLLSVVISARAEEVVTLHETMIDMGAESVNEPASAPEEEQARRRADHVAAVKERFAGHSALYTDDPDMLVRNGLLADRREKRIQILGEALPMNRYDPLEFFLIADDSGHDYEALAISFARPLAIYEALEFIGVPPGRPVNYDRMEMWPKGERVFITVAWKDPETGKELVRPIEHFVVDVRKDSPLPVDGFAFVGSRWVESAEHPGERVLASEVYDPHSIASDYNEPLTLLDVPRKALDGEVYSYQRINPDLRLPAGALLDIVIEAEYKKGERRVTDLILEVGTRSPADTDGLKGLDFELTDAEGVKQGRGTNLKNFLAALSRLTKRGKDPFVTVRPAADLSLGSIRELYSFLQSIATDGGIRIEPPEEGHLFYRAFLPEERFRQRATRPSQPWELHLTREDDTIVGKLIQIDEVWSRDQDYPDLETEEIPVTGPADVRKEIDKRDPGVPVMLIYAPEDLTYEELMRFVKPVLSTHPTVYVFLPEEG